MHGRRRCCTVDVLPDQWRMANSDAAPPASRPDRRPTISRRLILMFSLYDMRASAHTYKIEEKYVQGQRLNAYPHTRAPHQEPASQRPKSPKTGIIAEHRGPGREARHHQRSRRHTTHARCERATQLRTVRGGGFPAPPRPVRGHRPIVAGVSNAANRRPLHSDGARQEQGVFGSW